MGRTNVVRVSGRFDVSRPGFELARLNSCNCADSVVRSKLVIP